MRILIAVAAVIVATGCRRADSIDRRGDTSVTPPVSVSGADTLHTVRNCGISGSVVLTDQGIGDLTEGKTVAAVRDACEVLHDTTERRAEGMMERVLTVRIAGDVVESIVGGDRIRRIEVASPRYRTEDSLGVDTPLRRIARTAGARFFPGEDGVYGFVPEHCGLSFRFSVPLRPPKARDWTAAAIDSAHGDATVDRVLVTRCQR